MDTLTIYLIRHLRTIDNVDRRYSDESDPSLFDPPEQTPLLHTLPVTTIISSPLRRAKETAERWFPRLPIKIESDLKEMDFGVFSGKTANDMENDATYRAWVDRGAIDDIPGGETFDHFEKRVCSAFLAHIQPGVAYVTHAGPIMMILKIFAGIPYFTVPVKNGQIVEVTWSKQKSSILSYQVLS